MTADSGDRRALPPLPELSADERRVLAYAARCEAANQDDFRYWNPDPDERTRLGIRWRYIAGQLHPDPFTKIPGCDAA